MPTTSTMKPHFVNPLYLVEYDADHFYLEKDFSYVTLHLGFPWTVTVPAHEFPTDLASIPPLLRPFFKKFEASEAAVIHDWLTYRNGHMNAKGLDNITRKDADKIFLEAMLVSDPPVPTSTAKLMYRGVRFYSFWRRV
jgi:hypothetical protein